MFKKYTPKFWKRKSHSSRGGMFDPQKMSIQRIDAIDAHIESREKKEQDSFDKKFAEELAKL